MKTVLLLVCIVIFVGLVKNLNNSGQSDIIVNKEVDLIFSQLKEKT